MFDKIKSLLTDARLENETISMERHAMLVARENSLAVYFNNKSISAIRGTSASAAGLLRAFFQPLLRIAAPYRATMLALSRGMRLFHAS